MPFVTTPTPAALPPNGTAGGSLSGTYPNPNLNPFAAVLARAWGVPEDGFTAETLPRVAINYAGQPWAGVIYVTRLYLKGAHPYTTVTTRLWTIPPNTTATVFLGIYDYPAAAARLAVSADLAASINAVGAFGTWAPTLNYTPAADGFVWLALVIGSAVASPNILSSPPFFVGDIAPALADQTAGGNVALPSGALTFTGGGGVGGSVLWLRYA